MVRALSAHGVCVADHRNVGAAEAVVETIRHASTIQRMRGFNARAARSAFQFGAIGEPSGQSVSPTLTRFISNVFFGGALPDTYSPTSRHLSPFTVAVNRITALGPAGISHV